MSRDPKYDPSLSRVRKKTYRDYIDPSTVELWSLDVLKLMAQSPDLEFTIDELVELFNVSRHKAIMRFRNLVRWKLIKRRGEGRNLRFKVSKWGMKFLKDKESGLY